MKRTAKFITIKLINDVNKSPLQVAQKLTTNQLVELLKYFSDKYYNTGESVVSDEIYDLLKNHLEKIDPKNKYLSEIGAPILGTKEKVTLPFFMGSLDKVKKEDDLNKWIKKYKGPYVISDKLDGISAQLYKNNEGKMTLYSRGDGKIGQNISHLISLIIGKHIKLDKIPNNTSIRGELIITRKNFETIKNKMKNGRNAVAGLVNSKNVDIEIANITDFVAYSIIHPSFKQEEQMNILKTYNFNVVHYLIKKNISVESLSEYLVERRKKSNYEVDGIVVIDSSKNYVNQEGNPEYGFAFKTLLNDQIAEAIVIDVIWEPTMDSYLKPTIKIEPVELVGVTITSATAFNAKYVYDNKLGAGSIVKLTRSGDVIPYILEVIKQAKEPKMPDVEYKWIEPTKVDIMLINTNNESKDIVNTKKIVFFFKTIGVKYLDEGIVRKLVLAGYNTIPKILSANRKKLEEIDGLGNKIITKIYENIELAFKKLTLNKFMAASHIMGRGVGEKKLKLILDEYPNIFNQDMNSNELYDKIINIKGYSEITTNKIVENIQEFRKFYNTVNKIINISHIMKIKSDTIDKNKNKSNNTINKFNNLTIVFTGFRNQEWEDIITNNGGKVSGSVSSKTNLVVYKSLDENSSKITKAKELNITLISHSDFENKYINKA